MIEVNENTVLGLISAHKNSILETMGNEINSNYMEGYIDACNHATDVLYAYFKAASKKEGGK